MNMSHTPWTLAVKLFIATEMPFKTEVRQIQLTALHAAAAKVDDLVADQISDATALIDDLKKYVNTVEGNVRGLEAYDLKGAHSLQVGAGKLTEAKRAFVVLGQLFLKPDQWTALMHEINKACHELGQSNINRV
jgi:hypothetical protein